MSARGLDHVVHAVRDLDAAADLYARLGFLVGGRNRHPWGTHNRIVQLPGFYIELLTVAEPEKLGDDPISRHFGAFNRDFLARREGLSMLLLESREPGRDAAQLQAAGIAASEPTSFEREGKRPDGAPVTLGFTLTFARDPNAPETGFAVCHHHAPENFWHLAYHDHANTARAIAGVVLVADDPRDHHAVLSALVGDREPSATAAGLAFATPRGEIRMLSPAAFKSEFGVAPPPTADGARLAALRIGVREPAAVPAALQSANVPFRAHRERIVVGPDVAHGAAIAFEPG
jgi:hypothetical protein